MLERSLSHHSRTLHVSAIPCRSLVASLLFRRKDLQLVSLVWGVHFRQKRGSRGNQFAGGGGGEGSIFTITDPASLHARDTGSDPHVLVGLGLGPRLLPVPCR